MNNWVKSGLFLMLFIMLSGFLYSPYVTLKNVDLAMEKNDAEVLKNYIDIPAQRELAKTMIEGKLKIKKDIERQENRFQAWSDYGEAFKHVDKAVDSLTSPIGFKQMLKGNLDHVKPNQKIANYQPVFEDASISFDSLTEAHTFVKQDSGLMTKVVLKRTGIFSWNVAYLEYPVNEMLETFVKNLQG